MASTTVEYGRNFVLKIGNVQIGNLDGNGLNQSRDTRDTTSKDSADYEEHEVTVKRGTIPFNGKFTESAASGGGVITLQAAYENGTVLAWRLGNTTAGTHYWSGSGRLVKYDFDAPSEDNVVFEGEVKITGQWSMGTN
jgi:predicted secreted protein